jgi:fucose permease
MADISQKKRSDIIFAALGFAILAIVGLFETTKGTMIPQIRLAYMVDYSSISALIMLGNLSYILMVFLGGIISDLKGQKFVILIGCALTASSLIFIQFAGSFAVVCLLFFIMYLGFGCFEVSSSLVARLHSKYGAIIMSLLHFSFGAGTIIGPIYATNIVLNGGTWAQSFGLIAIPILACFIIASVVPFNKEPHLVQSAETALAKNKIWGKKLWIFIAILGLSLVLEFGVVNWFVNYLQEGRGIGVEQSSVLMTYFFVVFALGRIIGGFITHRIGYYKTMVLMCVSMLVLFLAGILLGSSGIFCFILFGFFIAIVFPTIMVGLMEEYKEKIASVMGIVISLASSINLFATWIMGLLNDHTNVVFGFNFLFIYALAIMVLTVVLGRQNLRIKGAEGPAALSP